MKVLNNEILLIYNSNDLVEKRALAYAKTLQHHFVKELDISKEQLTGTQIEQLAEKLNSRVKDLVDKESETYHKMYFNTEFDEDGALKALFKNPELMKTPIVVYQDSADFVKSSYDFVKQDMDDKEVVANSVNPEETKKDK